MSRLVLSDAECFMTTATGTRMGKVTEGGQKGEKEMLSEWEMRGNNEGQGEAGKECRRVP